ncbi:MAG: CHRD domain-containing protein [Planctomycetales bacterium]|nr:CHRD domain-containing protein [Planctomycetales bacterium]NIP68538.1 CHRD domain-containing protein [Planctomycetales bacterium]
MGTTRHFASDGVALVAVLFAAGSAGAAPGEDLSCGYFSADPDDRSGPPIHFSADLSDDPQRAPTDSPGVGHADFVLQRDTLTLSWRVTFRDLTSQPLALQMHGPVPAEGEAPALFDLAAAGFRSPVEGERTLSLGEVAYLVQNLLYVNLSTTGYPVGEIRGPVRKLRPKC